MHEHCNNINKSSKTVTTGKFTILSGLVTFIHFLNTLFDVKLHNHVSTCEKSSKT